MNLYFWSVPILLAVTFLIALLAKKMEWFLNVATRLCIGGLALYITGEIMLRLSMPGQIGVNPTTMTTVALLGVPGFLLVISIELLNSVK